MTKPASTTKKPCKQHPPEFRQEALKLAERIGVAAVAWRSASTGAAVDGRESPAGHHLESAGAESGVDVGYHLARLSGERALVLSVSYRAEKSRVTKYMRVKVEN